MKPRTKRFALAAFACAAFASSALADQASEALVRGWIEDLDKTPEWSANAATIASQGDTTVVSGIAIAREDGSFALAGEEVRFDNLSASLGFSTSAAAAKKLTMSFQAGQLTVPAIEMKGLAIPSVGGWSLDPKAPATSIARLYTVVAKTRLDLFSMPEATFEGYQVPNLKVRYADVRYEGLADGKLKLQSIGKIESVTGPDASFTLEGMSARNMDLAAIARVIDPDAYAGGKGDGKWVSAVEGGTYGKVTVTEGGKPVVTIADISFGEMSVRQTEKPFVGAFDEIIALGPQPPEDRMFDIMSKSLPDMAGWFKIAALTMTSLSATAPDGGTASLAKAEIADVSPDGMKRFALEGFDAQGPGVKVGLKRFEIGDVRWPSLVLYMDVARHSEAQAKGQPIDMALVARIAGSFFDLFPKVGRLSIEGVSIDAFNGEPISLESLIYTGTYAGGAIASEQKTELKNLVIPGHALRATPESAQVFDALGYDRLVIGGAGTESYDQSLGAYTSQSRLAAENVGALGLFLALGGLTPERIKAVMIPIVAAPKGGDPDPMALMAAASGITFNGFSLRFEDASLTRRLIAFAARMQNMDEQALLANTSAFLQIGLSQLQSPDFTQKTVTAVTSFLQDPKSITFSLKPASPLGVDQMMALDPANPAKAIEFFGVSITAND
jgi:hypothetical protein